MLWNFLNKDEDIRIIILIPDTMKKAYLYITSVINVDTAFVVEKKVAVSIKNDIKMLENFADLMLVTFLKIWQHIFIVILKKLTKEIIQVKIKIESNLWKKDPNSIYLAAEYKGINNVLLTSISNNKKIIATLTIKYNAENITDKKVIFLSWVTSLRWGGKNNK